MMIQKCLNTVCKLLIVCILIVSMIGCNGTSNKMKLRKRKQITEVLIEAINNSESLRLTNPSMNRLPGTISVIVDKKNFNNERFIKRVSDKFAFSTGSACSAGEPSYVIKALGLQEQVTKVIRITINKYTTEEDVTELINFLSTEL